MPPWCAHWSLAMGRGHAMVVYIPVYLVVVHIPTAVGMCTLMYDCMYSTAVVARYVYMHEKPMVAT